VISAQQRYGQTDGRTSSDGMTAPLLKHRAVKSRLSDSTRTVEQLFQLSDLVEKQIAAPADDQQMTYTPPANPSLTVLTARSTSLDNHDGDR